MTAFPKDLIPVIRAKCAEDQAPILPAKVQCPSDAVLEEFLNVAFHASMLTEEGRRSGFRIGLLDPNFKEQGEFNWFEGFDRKIIFTPDRPYTVDEINRLAPAADFVRTIICAWDRGTKERPSIRIWGLLDVGEDWHRYVRRDPADGKLPPTCLTVTSQSAGELSVTIAGWVIASLRRGAISEPAANVLSTEPMRHFFESAKEALYQEVVKELGTPQISEDDTIEDSAFDRSYIHFLERILARVRDKRHGGTLLMIPDHLSPSDTRITDRVRVKYSCNYDHVWKLLKVDLVLQNQFSDVCFRQLRQKKTVSIEKFNKFQQLQGERRQVEVALADVASMIASFTGIDGAVLMTDRFRVVGFGTEVIAGSPTLHCISVRTANNATTTSIDNFGTRHKSAFRFCSSFEESAAFIVSQDGGVKAVKRVGSEVVLWPDIISSDFEI